MKKIYYLITLFFIAARSIIAAEREREYNTTINHKKRTLSHAPDQEPSAKTRSIIHTITPAQYHFKKLSQAAILALHAAYATNTTKLSNRKIAVHEAGHARMAQLYNLPIKEAAITPHLPHNKGHVNITPSMSWVPHLTQSLLPLHYDTIKDPITTKQQHTKIIKLIDERIVCYLAGVASDDHCSQQQLSATPIDDTNYLKTIVHFQQHGGASDIAKTLCLIQHKKILEHAHQLSKLNQRSKRLTFKKICHSMRLRKACAGEMYAHDFLPYLAQTQELVATEQPAIQAIAQALLHKRRLTGKELDAITASLER